MPRVLEIAIQTALAKRGVAVVVLSGDVALCEAINSKPRLHFPEISMTIRPSDEEIAKTAGILNESRKVTIFGGAGCAGAHTELIELARKLKAPIVYALSAPSAQHLRGFAWTGAGSIRVHYVQKRRVVARERYREPVCKSL
jgi:thiamine pyrophosphate-dependent acetolactate synthase large subunit-like protein